eukprot:Clim_evm49s158 gene=Clim_evmTU49s158
MDQEQFGGGFHDPGHFGQGYGMTQADIAAAYAAQQRQQQQQYGGGAPPGYGAGPGMAPPGPPRGHPGPPHPADAGGDSGPGTPGANKGPNNNATVGWLLENYETAEGVSLPRSTLYAHYLEHCTMHNLDAVNAASFGKLIRSVFPNLKTRRLGTRGNSKYHYYGIRVRPTSHLSQQMAANQPSGGGMNRSESGYGEEDDEVEQNYQIQADIRLPDLYLPANFKRPPGTTQEDIDEFAEVYKDHSRRIAETMARTNFGDVEGLWNTYWRNVPQKIVRCIEQPSFQHAVHDFDLIFYDAVVNMLIPDVLKPLPVALTQAIRHFAKNLESWLRNALSNMPQNFLDIKVKAVVQFSQTLRRLTSLNHLAQAAKAVLQNEEQVSQMLSDLNRVDFTSLQEQAHWVTGCTDQQVSDFEQSLKQQLERQNTLTSWAFWLQSVIYKSLVPYGQNADLKVEAKQFLMKWSFYCSLVIRDLTLRSAASFGSFHLMRLLYDEFVCYVVERHISTIEGQVDLNILRKNLAKNPGVRAVRYFAEKGEAYRGDDETIPNFDELVAGAEEIKPNGLKRPPPAGAANGDGKDAKRPKA